MAKKGNQGLFKILLTVTLAVLGVIAISLDMWCGYIHFFGKQKETSTTVNIDGMTVKYEDASTGETVTETKTFLEVNVFNNAVEIRFNDLVDETQTAFFSQGIQFIIKDGIEKTFASDDVFNGYYTKEIASKVEKEMTDYRYTFLTFYDYIEYSHIMTNKNYSYLDVYEYQSGDDFETSLNSNLLQSGDEFFKLQVKEGDSRKVIGVKFKDYAVSYPENNGLSGAVLDVSDMTRIASESKTESKITALLYNKKIDKTNNYYRAYDLSYFLEYIASAVQGLAPGYVGETIIKMPDIFNFYEMGATGEYTELVAPSDAFMKLNNTAVSYDKIKITVHDKELESSSQSMFNKLRNYQNYSTNDEFIDMSDYLTGRCLLVATLDDLNWIATDTPNVYNFELSQEFKTKWESYRTSSFVKIEIDMEYLQECGITYNSFDLSSLDNYVLYQIETTQNQILYQGVQYA